jgi:hypothetical protein
VNVIQSRYLQRLHELGETSSIMLNSAILVQSVSIQLIALLEELYKETRRRAPDGPVCKSSAATDKRASPTDESASLREEYENFLISQTPSDVISTYPLVTQQGVSGGDEDADQHYVPVAQLCSPS